MEQKRLERLELVGEVHPATEPYLSLREYPPLGF